MRRGSTLVEVLVGLAVFTLLTGIIASVAIVSYRYSRLYNQVSLGQREAVHLMQGLSRELSRCNAMTMAPTTPAVNATWCLSCSVPEGQAGLVGFDAASGRLLWQKWVGIWVDADGRVFRAEKVLASPATLGNVDFTTQPVAVSDFFAAPGRRQLANSVARFSIERATHQFVVEIDTLTSLPGNPTTTYHLVSGLPGS